MLRPLVWSATTMGLSAAGYAVATVNTLAMPVDPMLVLLTLLLVQSLYLRDWLAGSSGDDDATNQPAKVAWLLRHRGRLRALALAEGALALVIIALRLAVLKLIVPGVLFVYLYTARVLPGNCSLKQLPGMKIVCVGGLWNLLSVWVQYLFNPYGHDASTGAAAAVAICHFGCVAALVNLNDLRDVEGDTKAGTRTLPVVLGRSAARWVSIALAGLAMLVGHVAGMRGIALTGLYVTLLGVCYESRQQAMWAVLFDMSGIVAALTSVLSW